MTSPVDMCEYDGCGSARLAKPERDGSGLRDLLPACGLLVAGLLALVMATLLRDGVPGQYVVITAPGSSTRDAIETVAAADGSLIGTGGFSNIVIAASDRADFAETLRHSGAWFVFQAPRFLGCTTEGETS